MTVARIKYSKGNELKYISHLDFQRTFHRMLNRAGIRVAHSQGFNPHPKVSYAMAMPVGMTSQGEYLDVELETPMESETIKAVLNSIAPRGLEMKEVKVYENSLKSISAIITKGIYKIEMPLEEEIVESEVVEVIEKILEQEQIEISRKNKKGKWVQKNIRPMIKKLEVEGVNNQKLLLTMVLSMGSNENLNPQILMDYMIKQYKGFKDFPFAKVHRVDMIVEDDKTPIDL